MTRKQFAVTVGRVRQELENIAGLMGELGRLYTTFTSPWRKLWRPSREAWMESFRRGPSGIVNCLYKMTLSVPQVRPAVLSSETAQVLAEFLGFRHVFRNVYGFSLSAGRLEELLRKLPGAAGRLKGDVSRFLVSMEQVLPDGS